MLNPNTILTALEERLGERFPGRRVYRDLVPEGFERPSFLVSLGSVEMADASCDTLDVKTQLVVTAFETVDRYHNTHVAALAGTMMLVQELFAAAYLRVGDRALHVAGNKGEYHYDYAEITVTLSYQDDRPGGETWPPMGAVSLNLTGGIADGTA